MIVVGFHPDENGTRCSAEMLEILGRTRVSHEDPQGLSGGDPLQQLACLQHRQRTDQAARIQHNSIVNLWHHKARDYGNRLSIDD